MQEDLIKARMQQLKEQYANNQQELYELANKMKDTLAYFERELTLYECLLPSCKEQKNIDELNKRIPILKTEIVDIKEILKTVDEELKETIIISDVDLVKQFKGLKAFMIKSFLRDPEEFNVHDNKQDIENMTDSTALWHMFGLAEVCLLE